MRESTIEKKAVQLAKQKGYLTFKFVSPNNRGVPDRMFIKEGVVFFIEFKAKDKKPTLLQYEIIRQIDAQGVKVYVVDDVKDLEGVLC